MTFLQAKTKGDTGIEQPHNDKEEEKAPHNDKEEDKPPHNDKEEKKNIRIITLKREKRAT